MNTRWPNGDQQWPRGAFTIHLAADELEAQRAGAAAHHGVDADELGCDGRVKHVGLHGAVVHVPLENLTQHTGLSPQHPAAPCPLHGVWCPKWAEQGSWATRGLHELAASLTLLTQQLWAAVPKM